MRLPILALAANDKREANEALTDVTRVLLEDRPNDLTYAWQELSELQVQVRSIQLASSRLSHRDLERMRVIILTELRPQNPSCWHPKRQVRRAQGKRAPR